MATPYIEYLQQGWFHAAWLLDTSTDDGWNNYANAAMADCRSRVIVKSILCGCLRYERNMRANIKANQSYSFGGLMMSEWTKNSNITII